MEWQSLLRDVILLALAALSLRLTPAAARKGNPFTWGPSSRWPSCFAGILVTIIPVLAMLRAGEHGAFAWLHRLLTAGDGTPNEAMYFWLVAGLSSFLDNAPTYLVFFNAAGGDAELLMGPLAATLTAISAGAVFMGANFYIGKAPDFMVGARGERRADAELPRLHGLVRRDPDAGVRCGYAGVLSLRGPRADKSAPRKEDFTAAHPRRASWGCDLRRGLPVSVGRGVPMNSKRPRAAARHDLLIVMVGGLIALAPFALMGFFLGF